MGLFSSLLGNAGTVEPDELIKSYGKLLVEGEGIELGFKLFHDVFIFTTKRLILIDKQGLTGNKIEYKSIPYKSISRFSIEATSKFDLDAELKIWVAGEQTPSVKKQFDKSVNIYDVHHVLASYILK